jgi:Methyltransferase domain
MQQLLWANRETRREAQKHGVNVIPSNFYSSIPSIEEIENSYEYTEQRPPYLDTGVFKADVMQNWLEELTICAQDFNPPMEGNEETCENGFFWKNSQFSYSDAMAYYAFLRRLKPRKVIEIGGGFSSLIAADALGENGSGSLTCIEPYPRPFLLDRHDIDLKRIRAQDINADHLNDMFVNGDVLFIDSTHTVKTGSDCLHIYLRLLPNIRRNIFIHIHDIFLPFGLPQEWLLDSQIHWTEQYLLLAWLHDNPRTSILFGSAYHNHFNSDLLAKFMHGRFPHGGASLWLEYHGAR